MLLKMIIALSLMVAAASAVDYCKMSCGGTKHFACENPLVANKETLWPKCKNGFKLIAMTKEIQDALVEIHNHYRNQVALGKEPNFPAATNMAVLSWDNELAQLAELNVRRCDNEHDDCMSTANYSFTGQNLALESTSLDGVADTSAKELADMAVSWYKDEIPDLLQSGKEIIEIDFEEAVDLAGHTTQFLRAQSDKIGCAASVYADSSDTNVLLTCNYSYGNDINKPAYKAGKTAADCKTGVNKKYIGLCNEAVI